jgi:hypothetical protein
MSEPRWEITILIGPCDRETAEAVAEHLLDDVEVQAVGGAVSVKQDLNEVVETGS